MPWSLGTVAGSDFRVRLIQLHYCIAMCKLQLNDQIEKLDFCQLGGKQKQKGDKRGICTVLCLNYVSNKLEPTDCHTCCQDNMRRITVPGALYHNIDRPHTVYW